MRMIFFVFCLIKYQTSWIIVLFDDSFSVNQINTYQTKSISHRSPTFNTHRLHDSCNIVAVQSQSENIK